MKGGEHFILEGSYQQYRKQKIVSIKLIVPFIERRITNGTPHRRKLFETFKKTQPETLKLQIYVCEIMMSWVMLCSGPLKNKEFY